MTAHYNNDNNNAHLQRVLHEVNAADDVQSRTHDIQDQ